jgi:hypothetical protein
MATNKHIEVESGEIAVKNSHGDIAIIPKKQKYKIMKAIREGRFSDVDKFVEGLPTVSDYAQEGGIYPPEYESISKVLSQRNKHLNWVDRGLNPDKYPKIENKDGTSSTHKLSYVTGDKGEAYVYPNIIQNEKGELEELDSKAAWEYAKKTKTAMMIPDVKLAEYYSKQGLIKH